MNDTGGGVTAIHDVPGDITRIGFHWMLFFPFCHSKGASICSSHGVSRRSRIFFVPNFRIFEFFSSHGESRNNLFYHELSNIFHTECRGDHGFSLSRFFSLSRIFEFSNCLFTRKVAECRGFFVPRLVLGPTDQREVIFELFLHTECRGWLWGLLFMRMGAIRRCL